ECQGLHSVSSLLSLHLHSCYTLLVFEGWGVGLWAVSDTHRFGFFVPDEDPPGNQVTPRVQKVQLLSHRRRRFALMLTPRSIPGEFVSPRILRHAPSYYILVTKRAPDGWDSARGAKRHLRFAPIFSTQCPIPPSRR